MTYPVDALFMVPGQSSPPEWFIVFQRWARHRLTRWSAMGRFKHVMCFGRVPAVSGWFFYEVGINATIVSILPDRLANFRIGEVCERAVVLKFVPPLILPQVQLKAAFLCTTAVAHLTGVPSSALRPDRFLRDCLAAGAEIVLGEEELPRHVAFRPRASARPGAAAPTGSGAPGQDRHHP